MPAVSQKGEPRPSSYWPRRLLIGLNVFVAVCIVMAGSGYAYLRWRFNQVERVDFGSLLHGHLQGSNGDDLPGNPMNVLLVGSDTRANLTGAEAERAGKDLVTGQRSDTMMVLHVDPKDEKAAILSIPRDLYVPIAGTDKRDRVNSAFNGGPQRLVKTIETALGLQINHYVEVDFVGFKNLVGAVGGVPIYVPAPARDKYSDLKITTAGCQDLTPDQALAYVRSRHYEYFESGRWHEDPSADLGRIRRQQDFIARVMKRSISRGVRNPFRLNRMIDIAIKNVTIDKGMSTKDIFRLGRRFRSLDPDTVDMLTLPTRMTRVRGQSVLRLKQPDASTIIGRFNSAGREDEGPPVKVLPSEVGIRTLNGSGVNRQAGKVATALQQFGFSIAGTGDADNFRHETTVIRYGKGQKDKARFLVNYLRGGAELKEDTTLKNVDVVLVVGRDFTSVGRPAAAAASPSSTSSTSKPAPAKVPAPTGAKGAPTQPQC